MDPLEPLITALHQQGRLRVWSLVITVFGDLVQHRGGVISTARLGILLSRIGIEPGTLRTALSRLSRDGWVERERLGRTSLYRLSPQGVARFAPATSLIYAAPKQGKIEKWSLFVTMENAGGAQISLVPAEHVPQGADCVVTGSLDYLSDTYRTRFLTPDMRAVLKALAKDISAVESAPDLAPLDAAAARVLLIHRWRRFILRHPEPTRDLLPPDAPLADPRADLARVYQGLWARAEAWLDQETDALSPMPASAETFAERFQHSDRP